MSRSCQEDIYFLLAPNQLVLVQGVDRHRMGVEAPRAKAPHTSSGRRRGLSFVLPGEPWRAGYVESFNGRVRDECLNINMFWSLAHARVVITDWKDDYNHRRRHSSLGYLAPAIYAAGCTHR